jgi:two-component system, sensor histidine kinase LadS
MIKYYSLTNILRSFLYLLIFLGGTRLIATPIKNWKDIQPIPTNLSNAGGQYAYFFTSESSISTDSILKLARRNRFKKYTENIFSTLTGIEKPVWFYFKTDTVFKQNDHLAVIENCNFNIISIYKYEEINSIETINLINVKGMGIPYKENLFPEQTSFSVEPNTIYFIECYDFYSAVIPLYVRTNTYNTQKSVLKNFFNAFYWGVISVIGIIATFFYIRSKEILFIFYAFFLFGNILLSLTLDGYLFAYVWPEEPEYNSYKYSLYALSAFSTPFFIYYFLEIKKFIPKAKLFFIIINMLFFLTIPVNLLGYYGASMFIIQIAGLSQITLYLICGYIVYKKHNPNAIYFMFAWTAYLISVVVAILSASNILPSTSFINNYVQIGTLIQVIIFSFIIAGQYQEQKIKSLESQRKLIDFLKERESSLTGENDLLEKTVQSRTHEIHTKNEELNRLNSSLNEMVAQQTWELQKSLEEIVATNDQLKQFNYITSHNLRGPISSLKGLMSLYDLEKNSDEQKTYIAKASIVINRMDDILIDLNKILSYKNTSSIKESIDFETIISNNLRQLDIKRVNVNLYIDERLNITGIKSFYESIFYNLFSNAQKYQDPTRPLKIDIQIAHFNINRFTISVKDNGLGMDESKIGDKLFGFYKRFHSHIEGKGLGLYITKNQIEILGGTIRAESVLGKGTTFIIELPC